MKQLKQYKHYKGSICLLLHIAEHSETGESLVIYANAQGKIYARPLDMFFENVVIDGKEIPRFKLI